MKVLLTLLTFTIFSFNNFSTAATTTSTSNPELQKTYDDIQKTLGIVPTFIKSFPTAGLPAAWEEMKSIQLSASTVLPTRLKELIGLAVASQIPCHYCVYLHTEAAKVNGASEDEIKEAVAMAALTRHWGTYIGGMQINEFDSQKDADKIMVHMRAGLTKPPKEASSSTTEQEKAMQPIAVIDSESAYKDMEQTLGSVPALLRMFPENGIASAWKMMKAVELNPETELSAKAKELISLGVASQMSCPQCTYSSTEAAKVNGANTSELREAIAIASVTRLWSTVLNGSQADEKTFKREVGQIMRHTKAQAKKVGLTAITKK